MGWNLYRQANQQDVACMVNNMKKSIKIILTVLVIVLLVCFFYPKEAGRGSCGMCAPEQYKWTERDCFGFKHVAAGCNILGFGSYCTDSPGKLLCYGIVYGEEKCYNRYNQPRNETTC